MKTTLLKSRVILGAFTMFLLGAILFESYADAQLLFRRRCCRQRRICVPFRCCPLTRQCTGETSSKYPTKTQSLCGTCNIEPDGNGGYYITSDYSCSSSPLGTPCYCKGDISNPSDRDLVKRDCVPKTASPDDPPTIWIDFDTSRWGLNPSKRLALTRNDSDTEIPEGMAVNIRPEQDRKNTAWNLKIWYDPTGSDYTTQSNPPNTTYIRFSSLDSNGVMQTRIFNVGYNGTVSMGKWKIKW